MVDSICQPQNLWTSAQLTTTILSNEIDTGVCIHLFMHAPYSFQKKTQVHWFGFCSFRVLCSPFDHLVSSLCRILFCGSVKRTVEGGMVMRLAEYSALFPALITLWLDTGWRRPIGCLKLQVIFRKRAPNSRALLRKMTYDSTPPCSLLHNRQWAWSPFRPIFLNHWHSKCRNPNPAWRRHTLFVPRKNLFGPKFQDRFMYTHRYVYRYVYAYIYVYIHSPHSVRRCSLTCDPTYSYGCYSVLQCVAVYHRSRRCSLTNKCHVSYTCEPWLIHMRAMTYSCVCHDSLRR